MAPKTETRQAASKPRKPATKSAARKPRPHDRARRDRGADTRGELIAAALKVFGRLGYEGASTREIATAAGANLAAIVYHFGGKEALYIAVAEHVAASIGARMGPTLAVIADPASATTPQSARRALHVLIGGFIEVILGEKDAELWARFIVREQMQPTPAFDVIYRILGGAVSNAQRLMAAALQKPEDDDIRLRVITTMGQVLIFRVAQTLVFRRMGWKAIGETERTHIKRIVIGHLDDILDAEERT